MRRILSILGGDMTGKAIIPIIAQGSDNFKVTLLEQESILHGKPEVDKMVQTIQNRGYYPYVTDPDEVQAIANNPRKMDDLFLGTGHQDHAALDGICRRQAERHRHTLFCLPGE